MTKITNIELLGKMLPIAGRQYCVGRVTGIGGELPVELTALKYRDGQEKVSPIGGAMANIGSVYVFVEVINGEGDAVDLRIVENYADFLAPFEFPKKELGEFEEYFLTKRCNDAMVQYFNLKIEDDAEKGGVSDCMVFVNIEEVAYIGSTVDELAKFFPPNKLATLQSHTPVSMVFADSLTRAIDVFNQINFYDKAKDIAAIASSIRAINQDGVKDTLTLAAVDDLFTMARKEIRIK